MIVPVPIKVTVLDALQVVVAESVILPFTVILAVPVNVQVAPVVVNDAQDGGLVTEKLIDGLPELASTITASFWPGV